MKINYTKEIELYGEYDVAVIGGGPSGVCAAIAAARAGARVILVESTPSLGGMATSGLVGPLMTCYDREGNEKVVGGIFDEIVARLVKTITAPLLWTTTTIPKLAAPHGRTLSRA